MNVNDGVGFHTSRPLPQHECRGRNVKMSSSNLNVDNWTTADASVTSARSTEGTSQGKVCIKNWRSGPDINISMPGELRAVNKADFDNRRGTVCVRSDFDEPERRGELNISSVSSGSL